MVTRYRILPDVSGFVKRVISYLPSLLHRVRQGGSVRASVPVRLVLRL